MYLSQVLMRKTKEVEQLPGPMIHIRDRGRQAFTRLLKSYKPEIIDMADEFEQIVLNHVKGQVLPTWDDVRSLNAYKRMIIRVATGLRSDDYFLLKQVLAKEMSMDKLPTLTDRELRSIYWEKQDALDLKKLVNEKKAVESMVAITKNSKSGYSCGRCRAAGRDPYRVEYTEFQTRSADEPATLFFYCTICSKRWRM
jgi:DNA-directed RNA polymerase subunit M/transcription elongation factor TFIIS